MKGDRRIPAGRWAESLLTLAEIETRLRSEGPIDEVQLTRFLNAVIELRQRYMADGMWPRKTDHGPSGPSR